MAIWQNIRRLASSGSVQGVQNPGPVEVLTPAQAVQILDDASSAVAPPRVPYGMIEMDGATPAVGQFVGGEIQARAGGVWIWGAERTTVNAGNQTLAVWRDDEQATTARGVNAKVWATGVPNLAGPLFGTFDIRVAAIPAFATEFNSVVTRNFGPLFVFPGERLFITTNVANIGMQCTLWFREVPIEQR